MLAVLPFILFAILFLLLPLGYLFLQAFQTQDGAFTLDNIAGLFSPKIREFVAVHFDRIDHDMEWWNVPPAQLYWAWRD